MYSEEYEKRWQQLRYDFKKRHLVLRAGVLGHYGTTHGFHGLAGWSRHDLEKAILRSEFPAEASNG